jgi:hypothetical protein
MMVVNSGGRRAGHAAHLWTTSFRSAKCVYVIVNAALFPEGFKLLRLVIFD